MELLGKYASNPLLYCLSGIIGNNFYCFGEQKILIPDIKNSVLDIKNSVPDINIFVPDIKNSVLDIKNSVPDI